MNKYTMNKKTILLTMMYAVLVLSVSLFLLGGCTNTLDGELNENIQPIIQFVNIPPEGQLFSRNPEVYWIGTDPDGLIDYYRYHIALDDYYISPYTIHRSYYAFHIIIRDFAENGA